MLGFLIVIAFIIFVCVLLNNASHRIGVPVLLAFIFFGIISGEFMDISIAGGMQSADDIATVALAFIMFYGGFGTRWSASRPVSVEAGLLSSLGVLVTAGLTGVFCHFLLNWGWLESMLLGAVLSSTDAASVFSILRSRKLGLKNGSAQILEIESGSNDPCSYMLAVIIMSLMKGDMHAGNLLWILFSQIFFGVLFGVLIAQIASYTLKNLHFESGFDSMFLLAVALASYAIPSLIGGNGYLSAYMVGIIIGNQHFKGKKEMVHFFDGFTGLMQVLIFFMLGLLAKPSNLLHNFLPAVAIFVFMLVVSRPAALALILNPFKKYPYLQQFLLSFCGMRGASSIVFAIMVSIDNPYLDHDLFNLVFSVVLLSIGIQGTFLPWAAKKFNQIDAGENVMKDFNDFAEDTDLQFTEFKISENSEWKSRTVKELGIPKEMLFCLVKRADGTKVVPNGYTILRAGDTVVLCSKESKDAGKLKVQQVRLERDSKWIGKQVREYPIQKSQLVLIQRGDESIIPHGSTVFQENDVLYINKSI